MDGVTEGLGDHLVERAPIRCRRRSVHFRADSAASNDVHAIRSTDTWHGVHEGELLDREAKTPEFMAQLLESVELVAVGRGALVLQALAAQGHLRPKHFDRTVINAIEKGARQSRTLHVLRGAAGGDAGTETLLHLVTQATRGPGRQLKELR